MPRYYLWVIFAFQVIAAVLLLVNRYVPLAVAVLAPVIVNILVFHALMAPSGLPLALFVSVLWAVIFDDVRPAFAGLFQSRLQARTELTQHDSDEPSSRSEGNK
jgi:putative oxidoreductase